MRKGNQFDVSYGNLEALKIILEMMTKPFWRNQIRKLTLDYITTKTCMEKK